MSADLHRPISPSIRALPQDAYEDMLIEFIGGEPDCTFRDRAEWLSAAAQAYDGDRTDLDAFTAETDAYQGRWDAGEAGWRLSHHAVAAGLCEGIGR